MPSKYRKGGRSPGELLPMYRNKVLLNDKGKPLGLMMKGQQIGSLMFKPPKVMTIKNYVNEKKKIAYKPSSPPKKPNKYNKLTKISNELMCMPQNFMYRQVKLANTSKHTFFKFIKANNKNGFSDVLKMPPSISRGLVPLGKGEQGVVLLGCIDDKCKTKVAIKIPKAGGEKDAIREFRSNKVIYDSCSSQSPHIVQPIIQAKCAKTVVTYYEFFNGGSLDFWLPRHQKKLTLNNYKTILFQTLYTLRAIYKVHPQFRHHDLHSGNIMVRTEGIPSRGYTPYGTKYSIKNDGIFTAIGDFGFSSSPSNPNPGVVAGEFLPYGVSKNTTVSQNVFTLIADLTKQAEQGKVTGLGKFFEDVTGVKMSKQFKGTTFDIRLPKNSGRGASITSMLDSPFFDSIKKGQPVTRKASPKPVTRKASPKPVARKVSPKPVARKVSPKPVARKVSPRIVVTTVSPKTLARKCGARAVKGNRGVLGMGVSEMRKLIMDHSEIKIPAGAKRGDLCKMLLKFPVGRKAMGLNNAGVGRAVATKNMPPPTYRVAVTKAPTPMKLGGGPGVNVTRRARGVQKILLGSPSQRARKVVAKSPKVSTPPTFKFKMPSPAVPKRTPKPRAPKVVISRNNDRRIRIDRKVCDNQSRKMLNEILVGFGMPPKDYKTKKAACEAIATHAQSKFRLERYVTTTQNAAERKQFRKNIQAGKF